MRNKSIFLSLILLFFFTSSAFSQEKSSKLSINIYGGYGLINPTGAYFTMYGDAHSTTNNNSGVNQTNSTTAYNRTKEALGNGAHIGLGVSYELNKFISIGIDADYLTGKKNASLNIPADTLTGSFASTHSALSIIPNISFRLLTLSKYHIYNTIGIIEAVQTKFDYSYVAAESQTVTTSNDKYKYGLNTGFRDALGIQIGVAKNIQFFAELSGYFLSARPTSKSEVIDYSAVANGVTRNQVTNANISYTNSGSFNYLQSTTSGTTNVSYNDQAPHQHFYSLGLNAGIRVNLPY
jgi:hypothetical protein